MSTTIPSHIGEILLPIAQCEPLLQNLSSLNNRLDLSVQERVELEHHAFNFACLPESYDIAVSDGGVLRSPCGEGIASVLEDGRYWHIAGGLLAPQTAKSEMIDWLGEVSRTQRRTIAVYNVSENDALRFQQAGFVVNKFGEEPILNLDGLTWSGKPYEWVRRQSNFCVRAGLTVAEAVDADQQQQLAATLTSIMSEDLSGRTFDKPLRLLEGEFNPTLLQRRRLFVAKSAEGDVEAFLACSPIDAGRTWAFETYRKSRAATRGVTAFLFRTAIDQLKAEGAEQISLCLVPGRNVKESNISHGDRRIAGIVSLWFNRLDFVFNAKGQDHFKARFRPQYESRYLCVAPKNSIGSLWSFLKTTGAINCNWRNLLRQAFRGAGK